MPGIRQNQLLSKDAEDLLQLDIRSGTHKIYKSRFDKFRLYCRDLDTDPEEIIVHFLTILTRLYKYSYSTVNGYRSAISRYHTGLGNQTTGCARAVRRVTKAVFNVKSSSLATQPSGMLNLWFPIWKQCILQTHCPC